MQTTAKFLENNLSQPRAKLCVQITTIPSKDKKDAENIIFGIVKIPNIILQFNRKPLRRTFRKLLL